MYPPSQFVSTNDYATATANNPAIITYTIVPITLDASFETGTAANGASGTITLPTTSNTTNNFYNKKYITLTGGTGSGQSRLIMSYVGSTKVATIDYPWVTPPDNTSTYKILTPSTFYCNNIGGITWSYTGGTPSGSVKIEDGSGNTVFFMDITSSGAGFIPFVPGKKGTANRAMIITLAAGGSGITGKISILGQWLTV